jgi:hypothetical protein
VAEGVGHVVVLALRLSADSAKNHVAPRIALGVTSIDATDREPSSLSLPYRFDMRNSDSFCKHLPCNQRQKPRLGAKLLKISLLQLLPELRGLAFGLHR